MKNRLITGVCIALALSLLLLGGCGRTTSGSALQFDFSFNEGLQGWTGEFADLPLDYEEDIYELDFGHSDLPAELGSGKGAMISGSNRSDDLFMFLKRQLAAGDGIKPNTTYQVVIDVELATDAPAGAFGIGGPPGEAVFVKVGAAQEEPVPVEIDGEWRLNVDKGGQSEGGRNAVVVGDAAKPTNEEFDVYERKTLGNADSPLEITSDGDGSLWIFVGTDSGFEGKTTLYYTSVQVILTEK